MKASSRLLVVLCLSFVVSAVIEQTLPAQHHRAIGFLHAIFIGAICYRWCRTEARERGTVPPGRSALWAGVLPMLGVPLYLYRTRGGRRGTVAVAKALGLFLACVTFGVLTVELMTWLRP